jgi:hypothetical protein
MSQAALDFGAVAVLGGAAGAWWNQATRRRELDLAAAAKFRETYGDWFAIWKEWEAVAAHPPVERSSVQDELLRRATTVEGELETLLLKIATSRHLTAAEISRLGRFREGYQRLRDAIETDQDLPFRVQHYDEAIEAYATFKALSIDFARRLRGRGTRLGSPSTWFTRPGVEQAQDVFVQLTSWRSHNGESQWHCSPGTEAPTRAVEAWHCVRGEIGGPHGRRLRVRRPHTSPLADSAPAPA